MSPSPSSPKTCERSSARSAPVLDYPLALLLFATGAQTPLLALLSLRRPRNLLVVVFPYVALGVLLVPLAGFTGLAVLVLGPSPLIGGRLAPFVGARQDRVGALGVATLVVAFVLLLGAMPSYGGVLQRAILAFVAGVVLAGVVPTVRDLLLPVLEAARYVAMAVILVMLVIVGVPTLDWTAVGIAVGVLVVGALAAAVLAVVMHADPLSATLGAGTRDPVVAGALLMATGANEAVGIPLAYAGLLAVTLLTLGLGRKLLVRADA